MAYRRGSVRVIVSNQSLDGHPSMRSTWELSPFLVIGMNFPCSTLDLAPSGGYLAIRITPDAGVLLPHRFILTCAKCMAIGGLLSAALIDRSLHPDSRQHSVHRSPDLPQHNKLCCDQPANSPSLSLTIFFEKNNLLRKR